MRTLTLCLATAGLVALAAEKQGDAGNGKVVFEKHCAMCHNATTAEKKLGSSMKGLYKKRKMQNGQAPTDANVRGRLEKGGGGMPSYKETLSAEEKADLVAYLKTL
jgi:mono/diheme cytochrome c family protein